jgi:hypothetical protein
MTRNQRYLKSSQLQVQEPEELTFVEQKPITTGGPGDLMQLALPKAEVRMPGDRLATVGAGLFVLS